MQRPRNRDDLLVRAGVVAALVLFVALALSAYPRELEWGKTWAWRAAFGRGLALTAVISFGALALGLLFGGLGGLARASRSRLARQVAFVYVETIRGTPFLVQLYVGYFCIANLLNLDGLFGTDRLPLVVGIGGLGLFAGAYVAEIVRAGIESIDRGQWEAARSLGLSHQQALLRVILPQAARRMLPPLTGEAVSLIKESSLLSIISVRELTKSAKDMQSSTLLTFEAFIPLALLYLTLTLPLAALSRWMERRLAGAESLTVSEL